MNKKLIRSVVCLWFVSSLWSCGRSQDVPTPAKVERLTLGERLEFHSRILDEDRKILVRLPEDYGRSKRKYPVLYLLDGEFFFLQASSAVQYLSELGYIRNQPIPPLIVVGIVNVDRNRDYTPTYAPKQNLGLEFPTSGKAEKFLEYLRSEVFPYIETNYRTEPYRILAGWSLGGLLTVYTYLEHPDYFSAYLGMSPSLWWDNDLYVKRTKSLLEKKGMPNKRIAVTVGSLEGGDIGRSVRDGFISLMKKEFGNEGFFRSAEIPNVNHNYVTYQALYEGLQLLYSDWQLPSDLLQGGIQAVQSFYDELSRKYAYVVEVPESAYSNLAYYVYNQVSTDAAVGVAQLYVKAYPESSFAHFLLGRFHHLNGALAEAKEDYETAIRLENAQPNPDSERRVTYTINLKKVDEQIKQKR
jgi:predicted alpha/beta superfamily hydrolase